MKILATGMEWFEHIPGGLNQYFADYLSAMNAYGHTVEGLLSGEGERLTAPPYIRDVMPPLSGAMQPGMISRVKAFHKAGAQSASAFAPDVFNPHFSLYASMLFRSKLPRHVPIVTHFHGPWAQESVVEGVGHGTADSIRCFMKKQIELLTYRRSDSFVVLSHYFKKLLASEYGIDPERIRVVPGAVDTARFRPAHDRNLLRQRLGIEPEERVLFCARRLVRRMGIDNLIRAMASVVERVADARLYIAGDGPLREELEKLILELGLSANIRLLGRIPGEELVSWYQAADYSVVPTMTLEGFGLVTTEALACGTPVLGTPFGGTKEILEGLSPELLFADRTPEAMAHKLTDVLLGSCRLPAREACTQYVLKHYTWQRVAAQVTEVFEHAVEARGRHVHYEGSFL